MEVSQVRVSLKRQVEQVGSYRLWAEKFGGDAAFACRVVNGQREPSETILDILGLEAVTTYRKKLASRKKTGQMNAGGIMKLTVFAIVDKEGSIPFTVGSEALAIYKSVAAAKRDGWFFDGGSTVRIVKLIAKPIGGPS